MQGPDTTQALARFRARYESLISDRAPPASLAYEIKSAGANIIDPAA